MAIVPDLSIDEVGEAFAATMSGVTAVRDAWVSVGDDGFDLWLLVDPLSLDEERTLYALVDPLEARYPSVGFTLHVLNPQTFATLVPEQVVPAQARHLGARAAR